MIWTESDYTALAALVFRDDYPGNATARGVVEAPDGNPAARDSGKRYAHVATKYLTWKKGRPEGPQTQALRAYLAEAWSEALGICDDVLGEQPEGFYPDFRAGCLRVLEYPAGIGASASHTDISLFTINLWRSHPNPGLGGAPYHMGRLGELLGLGPAEPHHVDPLPVVQKSLVYFAIPDRAAVLPRNKCRYWNGDDATVGVWLDEQMKTMRYLSQETAQ